MSISDLEWTGPEPPAVRCAVCGKPVDQLVRFQDVTAGKTVLEVRCHGEIERVDLDATEHFTVGLHGLVVAFQKQAKRARQLGKQAKADGNKAYTKRGKRT